LCLACLASHFSNSDIKFSASSFDILRSFAF
jgi:hypothetical protein